MYVATTPVPTTTVTPTTARAVHHHDHVGSDALHRTVQLDDRGEPTSTGSATSTTGAPTSTTASPGGGPGGGAATSTTSSAGT